MAARRQNIKDIQNKQAQAREQYAKNKNRLSEVQVKEKANTSSRPNHPETPAEQAQKEE
ncbi:MAG: hypothetical protein LUG98_06285 [Tannerellaceae bacterium]|nr:hypothetical protein [Tannerellaceae bacterium]